METLNLSHATNTSSVEDASLFSVTPYTTVEIVLIVLVAGSLSLITVIGNILVMLSIKVWVSSFFHHLRLMSVFQTSISGHLERHTPDLEIRTQHVRIGNLIEMRKHTSHCTKKISI